jgi:hypothetical protein
MLLRLLESGNVYYAQKSGYDYAAGDQSAQS